LALSLPLEALSPVKFLSSDELAINKDVSAPVIISVSRPSSSKHVLKL